MATSTVVNGLNVQGIQDMVEMVIGVNYYCRCASIILAG